jgi:hypothetical protein
MADGNQNGHHGHSSISSSSSSSDSTLLHPLRLVLIASYIPSIPLSITHGALSSHVVPALGLLPLTFSFGTSIAALRLRQKILEIDEERRQQAIDAENENEHDHGDNDDDNDDTEATTPAARFRRAITHPVTVFAFDLILAAAFMIVLVFTWISHGRQSSLSMLAAYATIPLLVNFFIHLFLATQAFAHGLAIHGLIQWTAWRTLPPDCPSCNVRLRPSLPELPWLKYFQQQQQRRRRRARARNQQSYAPVFVDDQDRYRDDVESGAADHEAEAAAGANQPEPEAVEVRRKDRKDA